MSFFAQSPRFMDTTVVGNLAVHTSRSLSSGRDVGPGSYSTEKHKSIEKKVSPKRASVEFYNRPRTAGTPRSARKTNGGGAGGGECGAVPIFLRPACSLPCRPGLIISPRFALPPCSLRLLHCCAFSGILRDLGTQQPPRAQFHQGRNLLQRPQARGALYSRARELPRRALQRLPECSRFRDAPQIVQHQNQAGEGQYFPFVSQDPQKLRNEQPSDAEERQERGRRGYCYLLLWEHSKEQQVRPFECWSKNQLVLVAPISPPRERFHKPADEIK